MEVTRKQEIGLRISSICGFVLFLTRKRGVTKSIYQLKINVNDNSLVGPILVEVVRDLLFFLLFFSSLLSRPCYPIKSLYHRLVNYLIFCEKLLTEIVNCWILFKQSLFE